MEEKNRPRRTPAGFLSVLSCAFGCLFAFIGGSAAKVDISLGICVAFFGAALFAGGLLLYRAAAELCFLYTYYAKLNRAVKKRADAIRAQKEALMNQPLAISAPEEAAEQTPDIPSGKEAPDVIVPPAPEVPMPEEAPDVVAPPAPEPPPVEMPERSAPELPEVIVACADDAKTEENTVDAAPENASQSGDFTV